MNHRVRFTISKRQGDGVGVCGQEAPAYEDTSCEPSVDHASLASV